MGRIEYLHLEPLWGEHRQALMEWCVEEDLELGIQLSESPLLCKWSAPHGDRKLVLSLCLPQQMFSKWGDQYFFNHREQWSVWALSIMSGTYSRRFPSPSVGSVNGLVHPRWAHFVFKLGEESLMSSFLMTWLRGCVSIVHTLTRCSWILAEGLVASHQTIFCGYPPFWQLPCLPPAGMLVSSSEPFIWSGIIQWHSVPKITLGVSTPASNYKWWLEGSELLSSQ